MISMTIVYVLKSVRESWRWRPSDARCATRAWARGSWAKHIVDDGGEREEVNRVVDTGEDGSVLAMFLGVEGVNNGTGGSRCGTKIGRRARAGESQA